MHCFCTVVLVIVQSYQLYHCKINKLRVINSRVEFKSIPPQPLTEVSVLSDPIRDGIATDSAATSLTGEYTSNYYTVDGTFTSDMAH